MVLISGDNAMGCEYLSHEMLTARLRKLTDAGVKVYTVPGNHDISRPDKISKRFVADDPTGTVVKAGTTYVDDRIVEVRARQRANLPSFIRISDTATMRASSQETPAARSPTPPI